ncbi:MAG: hypothetical protein M3257_01565 [Actinomycetota bacterium]|nr:hypothetical protein [Actinomycetota bacterium]
MAIPTRLEDPTRIVGAGEQGWRWVELPQPRQSFPPWSVVLDATRRSAAELVSTGR